MVTAVITTVVSVTAYAPARSAGTREWREGLSRVQAPLLLEVACTLGKRRRRKGQGPARV